jgi:hypothetical protein
MRLRISLFLALFLVFTISTTACCGQEDRGRITGLITDSSGALVPQATIVLRNEGTNVLTTACTRSR